MGGGGIGRAHDNDWVLPDPQRYLSAHHARVQFRDGTYYLLDTSTNGVYINESADARSGRRGAYPLRDGTTAPRRLPGLVSIDMEPGHEAPEASSIFPVAPSRYPGSMVPRARDIGAALNVRDLLSADGAASPDSTSAMGAWLARRLRSVDADRRHRAAGLRQRSAVRTAAARC